MLQTSEKWSWEGRERAEKFFFGGKFHPRGIQISPDRHSQEKASDKKKKTTYSRRQAVRHADEIISFPGIMPLQHLLFPSFQLGM